MGYIIRNNIMSKLPLPFKLKKSTSSIQVKKRKYSNKTPFPRQHLQNPLTLHHYITHKHTHTYTYIHTYIYMHTQSINLSFYIYTHLHLSIYLNIYITCFLLLRCLLKDMFHVRENFMKVGLTNFQIL